MARSTKTKDVMGYGLKTENSKTQLFEIMTIFLYSFVCLITTLNLSVCIFCRYKLQTQTKLLKLLNFQQTGRVIKNSPYIIKRNRRKINVSIFGRKPDHKCFLGTRKPACYYWINKNTEKIFITPVILVLVTCKWLYI